MTDHWAIAALTLYTIYSVFERHRLKAENLAVWKLLEAHIKRERDARIIRHTPKGN